MRWKMIIVFFLFLNLTIFSSENNKEEKYEKIKVTLLNPAKPGNLFWDEIVSFTKASAQDLNIDLTIIYSPNRYEDKKNFQEILNSEDVPDYLIMIFRVGVNENIFKRLEDRKIKVFTIDTDILDEAKEEIGSVRGKFKNWIGQMVPDDESAGEKLSDALIKKVRLKKGFDKKIEILALSGCLDASSGTERNKGLKKSIINNKNCELKQIVFTNWKKEIARQKTFYLLKRYPDIDIIWAAADVVAFGAIQGIKDREEEDNKKYDIVIGGIDWSSEGLEMLRNKKIEVSYGKHFMEGGLALILIFDYHHGIDFKDEGLKRYTQFSKLDYDNVFEYTDKLDVNKFENIDFKKLSKVYNKKIKKYDFSLENIMNCIEE